MPLSHLNGKIKEPIVSMECQRKLEGENINLGVIRFQTIFKGMGLDEAPRRANMEKEVRFLLRQKSRVWECGEEPAKEH